METSTKLLTCADIARWQDIAQKGATCTDLLPIVKEEAVRLYCALHTAGKHLGREVDPKQWRRSPASEDNDMRRFVLVRDEIVHLRRELDKLNNEILRTTRKP